MSNNLKREIHFFTIADSEKEERFLREKHKNGLKLVSVKMPCFYTFEECRPEDVVYKLDFNPLENAEKDRYIKMYSDYGWEYMQDLNEFSYFRKPAGDASDEDMEIFSDDGSRFHMVERIFKRKMIPLLVIFFLCVQPQLWLFSLRMDTSRGDIVVAVLWIIVFLLYIWIFIKFGVLYYRLKKRCK